MSYRSIMTLLWILIGIMLVAGCFFRLPAETKNALENFIRGYQGILTSIGTLVLVGVLSFFTTEIANSSASMREIANRRVSSELKTAEFRQQWIDALREDLAKIVGLARSYEKPNERLKVVGELKLLDARVRLRLNPSKEKESKLKDLLRKVVDAVEIQSKELPEFRDEFADAGAVFIKEEWENLKSLLATAMKE